MSRWRRPTLAALASLALISSAVLAHPGEAAGSGSPPPLKLEAARKVVTVESYDGDVYLDLGIYAVAGDRPFEVRAYRFSYDQPISAWSVQPGADRPIPNGLVTDFNGLNRFFSLKIKNAAGKTVVSTSTDFCPGGYGGGRRRPDAPATSPYPTYCGYGNPYSLGGVYGIQQGWASPTTSDTSVNLTPGTYTATLSVKAAYRDALEMSPADATATVQLKVVAADDGEMLRQASMHRGGVRATPTGLIGRAVAAPTGPLPDLRSLPAWGINVADGRYLNFSATVWNAGPSPLVVDGFRRDGDENLMDAYQYFFDSSGTQVGYRKVGTMEWDARRGHHHWHFTDFATYRLLDSKKKLVVRSQKEAFCLANTDMIDYTVPKANWNPDGTDLHTSCGQQTSVAIREVLDSGSGDTYLQYLPGQSFDLKGLKNGVYYIFVGANPAKKLSESSRSNNDSYRKVTIGGTSGHRTVKVAPVGIVKEPPIEDEVH